MISGEGIIQKTLKLLLPVFIPSWRFFDWISPSPRIEVSFTKSASCDPKWTEFRLRPKCLHALEIAGRMIWNPLWNEGLYLTTLAERLIQDEETFPREEIFRRIAKEYKQPGYLQFRLIFLQRIGENVEKQILYTADPRAVFQEHIL